MRNALYRGFSLEIPKSAHKGTSITITLFLGGLGSARGLPYFNSPSLFLCYEKVFDFHINSSEQLVNAK
jgi:hypothetical protein